MNDPIFVLIFLSIFHIIGGIAVGSTLRGLRHGFPSGRLFFLIWGTLFGCMPLAIGFETFANADVVYLFALEMIVLAGAILGAALMPDWMLDAFSSAELLPLAIGGLFLLIGIIVGGVLLKTEPIVALAFGGIFGGVGALVFFSGLRSLLRH